jgi:hypothetical protein
MEPSWLADPLIEAPRRLRELYHENSKIGRRVRPRRGRGPPGAGDGEQYPLFAVSEATPLTAPR